MERSNFFSPLSSNKQKSKFNYCFWFIVSEFLPIVFIYYFQFIAARRRFRGVVSACLFNLSTIFTMFERGLASVCRRLSFTRIGLVDFILIIFFNMVVCSILRVLSRSHVCFVISRKSARIMKRTPSIGRRWFFSVIIYNANKWNDIIT